MVSERKLMHMLYVMYSLRQREVAIPSTLNAVEWLGMTVAPLLLDRWNSNTWNATILL